jgi:hypothetical protein
MQTNWQPAPKSWNAHADTLYAANTSQGWHTEVEPLGKRWRWRFVMLGTLPAVGESDGVESAKAAAEAAGRLLTGSA